MSMPQYDLGQQSLSERVYDHIKGLILSGQLTGGERVPEAKIAQLYGISRTPVREAVRRLGEYGLIRVKPRSYAEVVSLRPEEGESISQLRTALETLGIGLLAKNASDGDLDRLEDIARQCDRSLADGDIGRTFELDSKLHMEMSRCSGNMHLYTMYHQLDAKIQLLRLVLHLPPDRLRQFVGQHASILKAARDRNADEAERLMYFHIMGQLQYCETRDLSTDQRGRDFS